MKNPLKNIMMNYLTNKVFKRPKLTNNSIKILNNIYTPKQKPSKKQNF